MLYYDSEKPTVTVNCSSPVTLNEGDDFVCVCKAEGGNPPANVTWFKNSKKFGETEKLNNTLTHRNVDRTATGTYKCEARSHTNDLFRDEEPVNLIVNCKY